MIKRIPRRVAVAFTIMTISLAIPLGVSFASHQFSDVPNSNIFHADIEAIAATGVTTGCGGGRYCPSDFVTREQMAAFMNRLGALGPGKIPVVNADRLDGLHANQLSRVAQGVGSDIFTPLTTSMVSMATVSIDVPAAGFVYVDSSATLIAAPASACGCTAMVQLRNTNTGSVSPVQLSEVEATLSYAPISANYAFAVSAAGTWTFSFDAMHYTPPGGTGPFGPFDVVLNAVYLPFGSTGGGTLGTVESDAPASDTPGLP